MIGSCLITPDHSIAGAADGARQIGLLAHDSSRGARVPPLRAGSPDG